MLLLGLWLTSACSLALDDYRIIHSDPGGSAGDGQESSVDAAAPGSAGATVSQDTDAGLGGGSGSGGAPSSTAPATWDAPGTLWDEALWN